MDGSFRHGAIISSVYRECQNSGRATAFGKHSRSPAILVAEPIFNLDRQHSGIRVMGASEGVGQVQQVVVVGEIQGGKTHRPILPERFPDREIVRGVVRQVGGALAIQKSGTVVDVERCPCLPGQIKDYSGSERVTLIVIEEEIALFGGSEVRQSTGHTARPFGELMRVCEMPVRAAGQPGRIGSNLPATDSGPRNGQRKEDIGVSQSIVIEKVLRARTEIVDVEGPAGDRNGQPEFTLLVAFTTEG